MRSLITSPTRAVIATLFLLVLAAFPFFEEEFYTEMVTRVMILSIFAVSLDLLLGYTGLISFGHAAWFGLGGYVLALLGTKYRLTESLWLTMPAAMAVTAAASFLVGLLVLRTRGMFFIMVTLAFAQIFYFFFHDVEALGGSSDGLHLRGKPSASIGEWVPFDLSDTNTLYYFVLVVLVALLLFMVLLLRSPLGRALQGIRENEHRMEAIGFPVFRYKLAAFTISGAFAGLAGYLFAVLNGSVNPEMLSWHQSADGLLILILGGMGQLWGGVIGAFTFVLLQQVLSGVADKWHLWMGIIIILLVLFLPGGMISLLDRLKGLWQGRAA
ncbi:branched-chain amino acid ABC transporter permease [Ottowia sp. GY511]|uniref:Branched-chain amino acid ABC transporter permease n=1 Tax=Ottowia flava TaxID=2675430 RepID=A0ABW4KY05_9BURK|nr:branched-chain amino acid ABC transporter permease [Ottowia sp. GY511]TXK31288.1 branched-chain amino acid ABC transporter permease [Ottowia sp. GY511]